MYTSALRKLTVLALFVVLAACQQGESRRPADPASDPVVEQQQPLVGPGLGNLTYNASELWKPVGVILDDVAPKGHQDTVTMANGYLAVVYIDGLPANGNLAFWDVSNPRAPFKKYDYKGANFSQSKLREAHAYGFTNGYGGKFYAIMQSNFGFQVWDWTDPGAIALVKDVVLPGTGPGDYTGIWWLHVQAPYVYAAGTDQGLYIVDISNIQSPVVVKQITNAQLGIARINQVHVIGNLMLVNYSENGTGSSILDVSDPANPVVKSTDPNNPPIAYGTQFNGGKWAAAGKQSLKLAMFNINFDAGGNPTTMSRYGVDTGTGLSGGGYLTFQDGFVIAGFSNKAVKFDTRTLPITQVGDADPGVPYNNDVDFGVAVGNLIFASNDEGGGSTLIPHQLGPDVTGPSVNFVSPLADTVNRNVKSRIGLTFTDAVDLNSLNSSTIIVRPFGGAALPGKYSTQNGIVNFFPDAPLAANTTYEIVVPAGGVKDWVGNGVPTTFTSRFSTGSSVSTGPAGCSLGADTAANVGASVTFTASGCTGSAPLSYSWSFGDGSPATAFSTSASTSHAYATAQHYNVILTVRDPQGVTATFNRRQTIIHPVTAARPTRSSTILHDATRARIAVVNSDGNTVTSFDAASPYTKRWEMNVGKNPRTLAQPAPGGDLWVAVQDDALISVRDGGTGAAKATITLPAGSRPYGVAFDPAGANAYVSLEGTGRLLKINAATRAITGDLALGPKPRGIAVAHDGARVLVTRFVSADSGGEIWEVNGASMTLARSFPLPEDTTTPSTESDGPGLPNYVQAVTITPDGRGAWVPSKKDNIRRGTGPGSDGVPFAHDSRVRTMISTLDLVANSNDVAKRKDINNADLANAVVFSDLGDWAFVATQGGNHIEVYDALSHNSIASIEGTGLAPRGLVLAGNRLYVQNFMSRDVAVYDVATVGGTNSFSKLATVPTQATELLTAQVFRGKQIFYNAADPRMAAESYTSCASCHLDGDNDGRRWDMTQFGEGVRATASLLGRGGVGQQGPVHWSGNFDEIQDFENDMRGPAFGGTGFLSAADWTATSNPLGAAKAGRNADLDALAAYVASLTFVNRSPFRNADGTMTAEALAGKALFESAEVGCASCHTGVEKTDSALNLFHDVGTLTPASGQRLGQPLTGLDTPTLLGVWASAPYLHDNSAATLLDVLEARNPANQHGFTSQLSASEKAQLVAYLLELDDTENIPPPPPPPVWTNGDIGAVGLAGSMSEAGGVYTVRASGADIWNAADEFHFIYQPLIGDGTITARVTSLTNTNNFAKAGVMMRESTAPGAVNVMTLVTPVPTNGFRAQVRTATNATSSTPTTAGTANLPGWVRLVRTGNSFSRFYSTDGTTWTPLGAAQTVTMPTTILVGLAVTSHNDTVLTTGVFDNVSLVLPAPPMAPSGLVATAGNAQVALSWTAAPGATSYNIKRGTVSGSYSTIQTGVTATSFTNTALANGTTYFYVVSASNATGESGNSNQASATPAPPPPPAVPSGLVATAGNAQVSLSWNSSAGATSYTVKRSTTAGGPYTDVTTQPGTSFTNTGLVNGTTYFFVVSASNGTPSANSAEVSATPAPPPPPPAPTGLLATAGNAQVSLSWNSSAGATSYTVKRSTTAGGPYTDVTTQPGTSFTNTGLSNGTTYFFVVSASNGTPSGNSAEVSATPALPPPPAPPGNPSATAGNAQVALTWTAAAGATSYTVKRSTTTGGPYATVQAGITATSFTNTGLTNGTTYFFVISATGAGGESGNSAQVSATPAAPPATFQTQDVGAVGATGSWSQSGNTHTVRGSGADIQGTADEFRYVYRTISGNATITARVATVQAGLNAFTKAAIMMRNGLTTGAQNVTMLTTPVSTNGHRMQHRGTANSTTTTIRQTGNGTAPVYLRIVRNGNTFTGSTSANGTTWTTVGQINITMPTSITVGLAVTSHADGQLATATFDNVVITTP